MANPQLVFDIEADDLLPGVTEVHCIVTIDILTGALSAYHNVPSFSPYTGPLEEGYKALEEASLIAGHNIIYYDIPAIQKVAPGRLPLSLSDMGTKARDTLLMSQVAWPDIAYRKDLPWKHKRERSKKGKIVPIDGYNLEAFGKRMGNPKGDPGGSFKVFTQEMLTYCCQDVAINYALWKCLHNPEFFLGMEPYGDSVWQAEHEFAWLMFLQQQHGWPFDLTKAGALQSKLTQRKEELYEKLAPLVPPKITTLKTPEYYMHPEYPGKKWSSKGHLYDYLRENKTERTLKERYTEVVDGPPRTITTPWNPGSREQVKGLLYGQYQWKPTKWATKNNKEVKEYVDEVEADRLRSLVDKQGKKVWHEVLDEDVLDALAEEAGAPELSPLAAYFGTTKMLGMLATGPKAHMNYVGDDGRLRGSVNSAGVIGGRCSHKEPNPAQTPACNPKKPLNAEFRACYTCLPGHKLVGFDASALEYRVMAHWGYRFDNGDLAALVDDITKDLHWEFTKRYGLVDVSADEPRDEHNELWEAARGKSKGLSYGIPYGAQAAKIARMLGCSKQEAEDLLDYMRVSLPGMIGLRDYITKLVESRGQCKEEKKWGKVWKRYVPHTGWVKGIDGRYNVIRSAHASLNTKLQGDGGIFMKRLLLEVVRECQEVGLRIFGLDCSWLTTNLAHYDVAFVGNIHDECQASIREACVDAYSACVTRAFAAATQFFSLKCPIRGEAKVGANWAETH